MYSHTIGYCDILLKVKDRWIDRSPDMKQSFRYNK